jgi:hypothetical protein
LNSTSRPCPLRGSYDDGQCHKTAILDAGICPNHFIVSINAVFNWAVKEGELIPANSFRKLKKLKRDGRKRTVGVIDSRFLQDGAALVVALHGRAPLAALHRARALTIVRPASGKRFAVDAMDRRDARHPVLAGGE